MGRADFQYDRPTAGEVELYVLDMLSMLARMVDEAKLNNFATEIRSVVKKQNPKYRSDAASTASSGRSSAV